MSCLINTQGSDSAQRVAFRPRIRASGLGLLTAMVALPVAAQGATGLLLGDVYRDAARASPRIAAARALTAATEARVPAASRPPDPELQLGFMNRGLPGLAPMAPLGMTQLQLTQMIPLAGKLRLAGQAADASAKAQAERVADVEWTVRDEVAMAFYDLYETDRSFTVMRRTLLLLSSIRETAESMYRVGQGRQADVLRAAVAVARMEQDTIRLVGKRYGVVARLNALLDQPAASPVATPILPRFPEAVPAIDYLLAVALESRPMIRAAQREIAVANRRSELARRDIWPDLTVGLQVGRSRQTMSSESGADGEVLVGRQDTEYMASLMIGASIPIFARSRQFQTRKEMLAMQRMAEAELTALRAVTRGQVARVHADLLRARSLSALYRSTVLPQAEAAVHSALSAYRTGSVDFMTLLDSRMAVNTYQQELLVLHADEGRAWAELEMLLGRVLLDAHSNAMMTEPSSGDDR